jgi:SAM-dependent methyltransferase
MAREVPASFDDPEPTPLAQTEPPAEREADAHDRERREKIAEAVRKGTPAKLRKAAESARQKAHDKRNSGTSQQNPTARRSRIVADQMTQADNLEATANVLDTIAEQMDDGTLATELAGVRSAADIDRVKWGSWSNSWIPTISTLQPYLDAIKGQKGVPELRRRVGQIDTADQIKATDEILKRAKAKGVVPKFETWTDRYQNGKGLWKAGIRSAAALEKAKAAMKEMVRPPSAAERRKRDRERALRELHGRKIPGFVPTPPGVIELILDRAGIGPEDSVLEPSAGSGNILEALRNAGIEQQRVTALEISLELAEIARGEGYGVEATDFLEHAGEYDRVVMNPPFEKNQDIAHVRHAYKLLKPGGRLVSVMSAGVMQGGTRVREEFRAWLDEVGGTVEELPASAFMEKGVRQARTAGVSTILVTIEKPAVEVAIQAAAQAVAEQVEPLKDEGRPAAFRPLPTAAEFNAHLQAGGMIQVTTHTRSTVFRKKHAGMFRDADNGEIQMREGRSWVAISDRRRFPQVSVRFADGPLAVASTPELEEQTDERAAREAPTDRGTPRPERRPSGRAGADAAERGEWAAVPVINGDARTAAERDADHEAIVAAVGLLNPPGTREEIEKNRAESVRSLHSVHHRLRDALRAAERSKKPADATLDAFREYRGDALAPLHLGSGEQSIGGIRRPSENLGMGWKQALPADLIAAYEKANRDGLTELDTGIPGTRVWAYKGEEKRTAATVQKMRKLPARTRPKGGTKPSKEQSRYAIKDAIQIAEDGRRVVATDGRHLVLLRFREPVGLADGVYEVTKKGKPKPAPWGENDPKFPDVDSAGFTEVPRAAADFGDIDVDELLRRLRSAQIMSEAEQGKKKRVVLLVDNGPSSGFGRIGVAARDPGGGTAEIDVDPAFRAVLGGYDASLLIPTLVTMQQAGVQTVRLHTESHQKPLYLVGERGELADALGVVMPIAVSRGDTPAQLMGLVRTIQEGGETEAERANRERAAMDAIEAAERAATGIEIIQRGGPDSWVVRLVGTNEYLASGTSDEGVGGGPEVFDSVQSASQAATRRGYTGPARIIEDEAEDARRAETMMGWPDKPAIRDLMRTLMDDGVEFRHGHGEHAGSLLLVGPNAHTIAAEPDTSRGNRRDFMASSLAERMDAEGYAAQQLAWNDRKAVVFTPKRRRLTSTQPTDEHAMSAGVTTDGRDAEASFTGRFGPAWVAGVAETREGRKLVQRFRDDQEGEQVGVVSINVMLDKALDTWTIARGEQTSRKHPASYRGSTHVIRASAPSASYLPHEHGHALSAIIRRDHPDFLGRFEDFLNEMADAKGSKASSSTPEEGFADFFRRLVEEPGWVQDQPGSAELLAAVEEVAPDELAAFRDAARAFAAHMSRSAPARRRSYHRDLRTDNPRKSSLWSWLLTNGASRGWASEIAERRVLRQVVKDAKNPIAGRRALNQVQETFRGTAADQRTSYQSLNHIGQVVNIALQGRRPRGEHGPRNGLAVHATIAPGGSSILAREDVRDRLEAAGFTVPDAPERHGDMIWLADDSVQDVIDRLEADEYADFEQYAREKTDIARYKERQRDLIEEALRKAIQPGPRPTRQQLEEGTAPADPQQAAVDQMRETTAGMTASGVRMYAQMMAQRLPPLADTILQEPFPFPGRAEGQTIADVEKDVARVEAEKPAFVDRLAEIERIMDATLLVDLLSGERTLDNAIETKERFEHYVPLFRITPEGRIRSIRPGASTHPTTGRYRSWGNLNPAEPLATALARKISESVNAYYWNRFMLAPVLFGEHMHRLANRGEQARRIEQGTEPDVVDEEGNVILSGSDKDVPEGPYVSREAAILGKRIAMRFNLDWKRVAGLSRNELAQAIADHINERIAAGDENYAGFGIPPEALQNPLTAEDAKLQADDVAIISGLDIFRRVEPRAVNVVAPWINGERRFYQINDPNLFGVFAHDERVWKVLQAANDVASAFTESQKTQITNTIAFALRSLARDAPSAMAFGPTRHRAIPLFYHVVGAISMATGTAPEAAMTPELLARALRHTTAEDFRPLQGRMRQRLTENIVPAGWSNMGVLRKGASSIGIGWRILMRPIELMLWATGQTWFSVTMEQAPRVGAFVMAKRAGLSDEEAQFAADTVTGNFSERPQNDNLHTIYRLAMFLNPGVQIASQQLRMVTGASHMDNALRVGAVSGSIALSTMTLWALRSLFMDDEDREREAERREFEALTHYTLPNPAGGEPLRVPFDYGIAGGIQSAVWNSLNQMTGGEGVDARRLAWRVLEGTVPYAGAGNNAAEYLTSLPLALVPPVAQAFGEATLNKSVYRDFADIVPRWVMHHEPADRALDTTPDLYRWLGKQINASPAAIQYFARNGLGVQLDNVARMLDGSTWRVAAEELAGLPEFGRLFTREPIGWQSRNVETVAELTEKYDRLSRRLEELYEAEAAGEVYDVRILDEAKIQLDLLQPVKNAMLDIRAIYQDVKLEREEQAEGWRDLVRGHRERMVERAREGLAEMERIREEQQTEAER